MSRPHAEAVAVLSSWPAPTARQEALRRGYLVHLAGHPDGLHRECRPDHLTASTLVLSADGERVLLTLHRKAGAWFQLGGHIDPTDAGLGDAALREATEESGIADLHLDPVPVQLDVHPVPFCGPGTRHLDVRFLAVAPPDARHTSSQESVDVRWWPADALPTTEPSLRELVRLGRDRVRVR